MRLHSMLEEIGADEEASRRWPETTKYIYALAEALYRVEHTMDWALSGDTNPDNVQDGDMARELLDALPDEWFTRGKWATIQAVQGRINPPQGGKRILPGPGNGPLDKEGAKP